MSRFIFAACLALGFAVTGPAAFADHNAMPASAPSSAPVRVAVHETMKNDVNGTNAPRHNLTNGGSMAPMAATNQ
jgi:hypothetical protein